MILLSCSYLKWSANMNIYFDLRVLIHYHLVRLIPNPELCLLIIFFSC